MTSRHRAGFWGDVGSVTGSPAGPVPEEPELDDDDDGAKAMVEISFSSVASTESISCS